jgi:hypothetical protein
VEPDKDIRKEVCKGCHWERRNDTCEIYVHSCIDYRKKRCSRKEIKPVSKKKQHGLRVDRRTNELFYPSAVMAIAKFKRIGRRKLKNVLVTPVFPKNRPLLDKEDRERILRFFEQEWGGHHHVIIIPNILMELVKA